MAVLFSNIEDYEKAASNRKETIRINTEIHGPAFSGHRTQYGSLIQIYSETGEKEKEQRTKMDEWEKLQEKKGEENGEKQEEMTMVELIKFVTVGDTIEP